MINSNSANVVGVEAVYPHEYYNPSNSYINDIALVKLASPIDSSLFEYKVKLPTRGSFFTTGTPAVLSGWGRNGVSGGTAVLSLQFP
jgi:secreted trypsin-like serine protease